MTSPAANVGGIIGAILSETVVSLSQNVNAASVTGTDSVGGLVGLNSGSLTINNSYHLGNNSGTEQNRTITSTGAWGGLVGSGSYTNTDSKSFAVITDEDGGGTQNGADRFVSLEHARTLRVDTATAEYGSSPAKNLIDFVLAGNSISSTNSLKVKVFAGIEGVNANKYLKVVNVDGNTVSCTYNMPSYVRPATGVNYNIYLRYTSIETGTAYGLGVGYEDVDPVILTYNGTIREYTGPALPTGNVTYVYADEHAGTIKSAGTYTVTINVYAGSQALTTKVGSREIHITINAAEGFTVAFDDTSLVYNKNDQSLFITETGATSTQNGHQTSMNLSAQTEGINDTQAVTYSYYTSLANAQSGTSALAATYHMNVGTYYVRADFANFKGNYESITVTNGGSSTELDDNDANWYAYAILTITKKALTISWTAWNANGATETLASAGGNVTYDKKNHGLTVTVGGVYSGDSITVTFTKSANVTGPATVSVTSGTSNTGTFYASIVGDYAITADAETGVTGTNGGNYTLPGDNLVGEFHIVQRTLVLTWTYTTGVTNTNQFTYDGALHGAYLTVSGVQGADTVNLNFAVSGGTAYVKDGSLGTGSLATKQYTSSTSGAVYFSAKNYSNQYTATITMGTGGESEYYQVSGDAIKTWKINKRTATITWKVKDATANITKIGTTQNNDYTGNTWSTSETAVANLISGDSCTVTVTASPSTIKNAGTYTLTVTNLSNSNYAVGTGDNYSTTFTINRAPISVTWSTTSGFTYNATAQGRTATFTGIKNSETVSFTAATTDGKAAPTSGNGTFSVANNGTRAFTAVNANGTQYGVTIASFNTGNYVFEGASTTWTIGQAPISFAWADDNNLVYSAAGKGATLTVTGQQGSPSETLKFTYAVNGGAQQTTATAVGHNGTVKFNQTNAGTYTIVISAIASGGTGTASNYALPAAADCTHAFTITKAPITLNAELAYYVDSTTLGYTWNTFYGAVAGPANKDSFVYSGASVLQGYVVTPSGVISGQTIKLKYTGTSYTGYTGVALTNTADFGAETRRYDSNGATIANNTYNYVQGTTGKIFAGVAFGSGNFAIELASDSANNNYSLTKVTYSWTVGKKSVSQYSWSMTDGVTTITSGFSTTYNGNTWTVSAAAQSKTYAQGITSGDGYAIVSNVAIPTSAVTDYTATNKSDHVAGITASQTVGTYYTTLAATQAWHITAKTLGFAWSNDANLVYAAANKGTTLTVTGQAGTETLKFTYNVNGGSSANTAAVGDGGTIKFNQINAGSYTVAITAIASGGTGTATNYALPAAGDRSHTFAITAKAVTIAWSVKDAANNVPDLDNVEPVFSATYTGRTWTFTPAWTSESAGSGTTGDGKAYSSSVLTYEVSAGALTTASANASDTAYTVTIASTNGNYTLSNATAKITICKDTFTALSWSYQLTGGSVTAMTTTKEGHPTYYTTDTIMRYAGLTKSYTISAIATASNPNAVTREVAMVVGGDYEEILPDDYVATVSNPDPTNYTLTGITTALHWTISKAQITASFANYGGNAPGVYSGNKQGKTLTISGYIDGSLGITVSRTATGDNAAFTDGPTSITGNTGFTNGTGSFDYLAIHAGSYTVTLSISNSSNYELAAAASESFTISQKGITFTYYQAYFESNAITYTNAAFSSASGYRTANNTYTYAGSGSAYAQGFRVAFSDGPVSTETIQVAFTTGAVAYIGSGTATSGSASSYTSRAAGNYTATISSSQYIWVVADAIGRVDVNLTGIGDGTGKASDYSVTTRTNYFTINKKAVNADWTGNGSEFKYTGSAQGATAAVASTEAYGYGTASDGKAFTSNVPTLTVTYYTDSARTDATTADINKGGAASTGAMPKYVGTYYTSVSTSSAYYTVSGTAGFTIAAEKIDKLYLSDTSTTYTAAVKHLRAGTTSSSVAATGISSISVNPKNQTGINDSLTVTTVYYTNSACTDAYKTTSADGAETTGGAPKNAGTYYVKVTLSGTLAFNYSGIQTGKTLASGLTTGYATLTITKAKVELVKTYSFVSSNTNFLFSTYYSGVTATTSSVGAYTYAGSEVMQGVCLTVTGLYSGDTITLKATAGLAGINYVDATSLIAQDAVGFYQAILAPTALTSNTQTTCDAAFGASSKALFVTSDIVSDASVVADLISDNYEWGSGSDDAAERTFGYNIGRKNLSQFNWQLDSLSSGVYTTTYTNTAHNMKATAQSRDLGAVSYNDGYAVTSTILFSPTGTNASSLENAQKTAAGTYVATKVSSGNPADAPNYRVGADVAAPDWTISKKEVSLTWAYTAKTYNGNAQSGATATVNSADVCAGDSVPTVTSYVYSGTVRGTGTSYGGASTTTAPTNAGTYTATAYTISNANYKFADGSKVSSSWTIAPAPLAVTATTYAEIYNGAYQDVVRYDFSGFVNNSDTIGFRRKTSVAAKTSDGTGAVNTTLTADTWNGPIALGGSNVKYMIFQGVTAGSYTAYVYFDETVTESAKNNNYTLNISAGYGEGSSTTVSTNTAVTATGTIAKANITGISLTDQTVTYTANNQGITTYANANGTASGTDGKTQYYALDGVTVEVAYVYYTNAARTTQTTTSDGSGATATGGAPRNVNMYYVRATVTPSDTDNYNTLVIDRTFRITAATISLTMTAYNSTGNALSFSGTNTLTGSHVVYDGNGHGVTLTFTGILGSDNVKAIFTKSEGLTVTPTLVSNTTNLTNGTGYTFYAVNYGNYSVVVSAVSDSNYTIVQKSASWTIGKRDVALTWGIPTGDTLSNHRATYDKNSHGL